MHFKDISLFVLSKTFTSLCEILTPGRRLGEDLATAIEKITRDYTIGFGSFVDKELLPYISLKPGENCQQKGGKCPPPYR